MTQFSPCALQGWPIRTGTVMTGNCCHQPYKPNTTNRYDHSPHSQTTTPSTGPWIYIAKTRHLTLNWSWSSWPVRLWATLTTFGTNRGSP